MYDECWVEKNNIEILENGIKIEHKRVKYTAEDEYGVLGNPVPAESEYQYIFCGKGEWTANTIEDAKQMAIDFARGVA